VGLDGVVDFLAAGVEEVAEMATAAAVLPGELDRILSAREAVAEPRALIRRRDGDEVVVFRRVNGSVLALKLNGELVLLL
jgi:hypothetical protein